MTPKDNPESFTILQWLREYERPWLRHDLVAGATVAALVVPKALGYAGIVGVPVEYGLYAAAAGALIYALFGTSRQISTGPSSALATVAGGAAVLLGVSGGGALPMVAWVTLLAGALFLLLALLRMGWISQFLSKAVVKGFLFGAALDVVVGELPKLTGTAADGASAWREFGSWVRSLGATDGTTLLVGLLSLALILSLRFLAKQTPGALIVVVLGILATRLLELQIALVGEVPSGLPAVVLPDFAYLGANISVIAPAALGVLLIGFSQSAGDAREFASRHGYRVDINQESVAQGLANAGSGLVQGIPVATSLSASSLNDQAGAKTQMSSLATGILVLLTMLFLASLFSDLPKAVLAAVIIDAVVFGMIDVPAVRRLYRVARFDFWIAVAAILGVLTFGVLAGVIIGMLLSIVWLVHVSTHPNIAELGNQPGTQVFRDLESYPDDTNWPGLLIVRVDGGLFFANADALHDRLREILYQREPPIHSIILDCGGMNFIDSQGAEKLRELHELADHQGLSLHLSNLRPSVREVLREDGLLDLFGKGRIHTKTFEAVEAQLGGARHIRPGSERSE
jgi:high affinity sulfate transporter 1